MKVFQCTPAVRFFANGNVIEFETLKRAQEVAASGNGGVVYLVLSVTAGSAEDWKLEGEFATVEQATAKMNELARTNCAAHENRVFVDEVPATPEKPAESIADIVKGDYTTLADMLVCGDCVARAISKQARAAYRDGGQIELSFELAHVALLDHAVVNALTELQYIKTNGFPGVWGYEVSEKIGSIVNESLLKTGSVPGEEFVAQMIMRCAFAMFSRAEYFGEGKLSVDEFVAASLAGLNKITNGKFAVLKVGTDGVKMM